MSDKDVQLEFNYSGVDDMPTPLELSIVSGDEVSTVKLPEKTYPDGVWETCLFFMSGHSQVLAQYTNEEDARAGHRKIVDGLLDPFDMHGVIARRTKTDGEDK